MNTAVFDQDVLLIESTQNNNIEKQTTQSPLNDITYLSNDDFLFGTYRITKPGIYMLTEDILINFNAPSEAQRNAASFSPNSYDDLYWMPLQDGSQDDEYMGSS